MSEHLSCVDDSESLGYYPHPSLRPKRDRRQTSGRVPDRGGLALPLDICSLAGRQAIAQIGL